MWVCVWGGGGGATCSGPQQQYPSSLCPPPLLPLTVLPAPAPAAASCGGEGPASVPVAWVVNGLGAVGAWHERKGSGGQTLSEEFRSSSKQKQAKWLWYIPNSFWFALFFYTHARRPQAQFAAFTENKSGGPFVPTRKGNGVFLSPPPAPNLPPLSFLIFFPSPSSYP